jgi:hypothetical protein
MRRISRILLVFSLVVFFVVGISCVTHAAPFVSIASLMGCSQAGAPMAMAGCDHPSYLCGTDGSSNLLIQGLFSATDYKALSKNAHDLAIDDVPLDASKEAALTGKHVEDSFLVHGSHKVSTRLLNSTLNL